jgi:PAS domain S-box-containing protein
MVTPSRPFRPDSTSYLHGILDASEIPDLHRFTALLEHLFQVPIAYIGLLGSGGGVTVRIGRGVEYGACLSRLRLEKLVEEPHLVRHPAGDLPPGSDFADLQFAASALLRGSNGMLLGVVVIADRAPRPGFSPTDFRALQDLATVLAGKMQLRMVASLALEAELLLREAGENALAIAHHAPVPLIYSRADGSCQFVNQAWLDFTGRTRDQELAHGWPSLVHPDYRKAVIGEWRRALESQGIFTAEAPLRRHDGQYRWMLGKGAPRFYQGGFDGYVGCLIDITDYRGDCAVQAHETLRCTCGRVCPLQDWSLQMPDPEPSQSQ